MFNGKQHSTTQRFIPPPPPSSHRPLNSHLLFQTPFLWPTITPGALDLRSLFCGEASPGTPTKISSTAIQRRRTWHWLKCLKVTWNNHRANVSMLVFQMSFSLSDMWSLHRNSEAAVLAGACLWARSHWPDQQRLHQWWPDRMDERGSLSQLQEALWGLKPCWQTVY